MSDAKELREAIDRVRTLPTWNVSLAYCEHIETVIAAAEAHLATLPREVTIEEWVTVSRDGTIIYRHSNRADADSWAKDSDLTVAHLTGKALLPGSKE